MIEPTSPLYEGRHSSPTCEHFVSLSQLDANQKCKIFSDWQNVIAGGESREFRFLISKLHGAECFIKHHTYPNEAVIGLAL